MIPAPVTLATAPEAQPVVESSQLVAAASPSSLNRVEPELPAIKHVVAAEDTFWSLAQRYGVSAEAIAKLNNLSTDATLTVGQSLKIPTQFDQPIAVGTQELAAINLPQASAEVATLRPSRNILGDQTETSNLKRQESEAIASLRAKQETLAADIDQIRSQQTEVVFDAAEAAPARQPETLISSAAVKALEKEPEKGAVTIPVPLPQQARKPEEMAERVSTDVTPLVATTTISSSRRLPEPPSLQEPNTGREAIRPEGNAAVSVPPEVAANSIPEPKAEDSVVISRTATTDAPDTSFLTAAAPRTHTVRSGETLYAIARRYGVAGQDLIAANRIENPNIIKVDQQLVIPSAQTLANRSDFVALVPQPEANRGSSEFIALLPQPEVNEAIATEPETIASAPSLSTVPTRNERGDELVLSFDVTAEAAVNQLKADIAQMRREYQEQRASASPKTPVVEFTLNTTSVASAPTMVRRQEPETVAVNPEWKGTEALRSTPAIEETTTAAVEESVILPDTPQQLAAASQQDIMNYNSLLRLSVGEEVSPQLPPLANPDDYLPGNSSFNGYIWPAKGVLTSGFGRRWGRMHQGIDIAAPVGTPIFAAASGEVVSAGWNSGGYGNLVKIKHSDDSVTLYAHNSRIMVRKGQQVKQGQQIAAMGSTGFSTGPHLHFEVHKSGKGAQNPIAFLPSR